VGNRLSAAFRVVVADERAPAVRDHPIVALDAHLEAELEARALQLGGPDERADLVAVVRRRAVGDVALGEDEAERRGLEEAQELDRNGVGERSET
jgi:hypothetical protein